MWKNGSENKKEKFLMDFFLSLKRERVNHWMAFFNFI